MTTAYKFNVKRNLLIESSQSTFTHCWLLPNKLEAGRISYGSVNTFNSHDKENTINHRQARLFNSLEAHKFSRGFDAPENLDIFGCICSKCGVQTSQIAL